MWTSATYISFCTNIIEQFQIYIQALKVSQNCQDLLIRIREIWEGLNRLRIQTELRLGLDLISMVALQVVNDS